jgi:hypothetical protein
MSEFADNAVVEVSATRPLPGPGHRFPSLDFTLTYETKEVSGEKANAIRGALSDTTFLSDDEIRFELVEERTQTDRQFASSSAESLAEENDLTFEDLGVPSGKTGFTKADVQSAIDAQQNDSEEEEPEESEGA